MSVRRVLGIGGLSVLGLVAACGATPTSTASGLQEIAKGAEVQLFSIHVGPAESTPSFSTLQAAARAALRKLSAMPGVRVWLESPALIEFEFPGRSVPPAIGTRLWRVIQNETGGLAQLSQDGSYTEYAFASGGTLSAETGVGVNIFTAYPTTRQLATFASTMSQGLAARRATSVVVLYDGGGVITVWALGGSNLFSSRSVVSYVRSVAETELRVANPNSVLPGAVALVGPSTVST